MWLTETLMGSCITSLYTAQTSMILILEDFHSSNNDF